MVKSMRQTIQFVPWTQMLTENAVSQFWGERAKVYPSATDPPPNPSTQSVLSLEHELDPLAG